MADNEADESLDLDKESQLFPQHDTEGSADNMDDGDNGNDEAAQAAAQQKPDEQSGGEPEQKAGQEPEPKPAVAPQEFDPAAIKVPEGVTADPALMQDFAGLVGEMNLSQEQAQALVDLQVKAMQAQENQFVELRRNWVEEIKADPKYGGERLESTLQDAAAVVKRFDESGEVMKTLTASGFGDNPAIIKMLANIRRRIADHEFVTASDKATGKQHLYDRLWPDQVAGK